MGILNYSTKISADKTIGEIQRILAEHGAKKISIDYEDGRAIGLTFGIIWNDNMIAYSLPCRHEGVLRAMSKQRIPRSFINKDQAFRTSWRIIKDWISAQIALIEAEVASMAEIFLPYAVTKTGDTLYQSLDKDNSVLLLNQ